MVAGSEATCGVISVMLTNNFLHVLIAISLLVLTGCTPKLESIRSINPLFTEKPP
jgi:hypothetical protein